MVSHEAITGFPTLQTRIEGGLQLSTHNPTLTVVEDFAEVRAELRVGTCANGLGILANNVTLGISTDETRYPEIMHISMSRPAKWITGNKELEDIYTTGGSDNFFAIVDIDAEHPRPKDRKFSNYVYHVPYILQFQAHNRHIIEVPEPIAAEYLPSVLLHITPKEMHGCTGALLNFARVMAHYLPE